MGKVSMQKKSAQAAVSPRKDGRIKRYEDFWPHYLREHGKPQTRRIHFIGTSLVILCALLLIFTANLIWLFILPIAGYGPAWIGHFYVEKNRPATFRYPLWSLYSDFRMFFTWLKGGLWEELQWAGASDDRKPF
jgi:hypothetical protein